VIIAGVNPATPSPVDFWSYWRPQNGFDKTTWFQDYQRERLLRPLKPGKTRRASISNTRRVIEWLIEEAAPVRCLETNIYSQPSAEVCDLRTSDRNTAVFDLLLDAIKPRLVIAHGLDAATHLNGKISSENLICVPHFSRGWSEVRARALGRQVRDLCAT
jgi:hypothetical protein